MLSAADNELLTRVGPGTAMGNFMRQYWIPAMKSEELPSPDCPPIRIRLLGENLIGFRTTSGAVGLMQNACPHRGASMFFGRNEEEGLRCVYHGWKFDTTGACIDMPSEPAESNFKSKVHATVYPCIDRGGIVWTYMGPRSRDDLPPLPDVEHNMIEAGEKRITALHRPCNWMQGWEGEMDTVHAAFLHYGAVKVDQMEPGTFDYYQFKERSPKFAVMETDIGVSYGAYRPAEEDTYYWRIAHMMFPFFAIIPAGWVGMYVPIDDENTMHWEILTRPDGQQRMGGPAAGSTRPAVANSGAPPAGAGQGGPPGMKYLPRTSDWLGRYNIEQNMANDYLIDREAQRNWKSYTGIAGVRQQDMAVTESMGAIYDRTHEHLGTTDALIIRTRRKVIAMAKALRDQGIVPPGVDAPEMYHKRSGEVILPRTADWWQATRERREKFEGRKADAQAVTAS